MFSHYFRGIIVLLVIKVTLSSGSYSQNEHVKISVQKITSEIFGKWHVTNLTTGKTDYFEFTKGGSCYELNKQKAKRSSFKESSDSFKRNTAEAAVYEYVDDFLFISFIHSKSEVSDAKITSLESLKFNLTWLANDSFDLKLSADQVTDQAENLLTFTRIKN